MKKKKHNHKKPVGLPWWLGLVLIALVVVVAYSNSFTVPFQFDDARVINPGLSEFMALPIEKMLRINRAMGYVTFGLNYQMHGGEVWGYHAVNLVIHITATVLVSVLTRQLLRTPQLKNSWLAKYRDEVAMGAGLVFATHPIQTQAVTYIVQRLAALATVWYVAGIASYIEGRLNTGWRRWGWYVLSVVCFVLGMYSKETLATFGLMMVMVEMIGFGTRFNRKLAVGFVTMVVAVAGLALNFHGVDYFFYHKTTITGEVVTPITYALTQTKVVVKYMRLVVWPVGQNVDHHVPVAQSLFDPLVLMGFTVLGVILAGASYVYKKAPLISIGVWWFFVGLTVESTVITVEDVMFEHRLYLPMVGVSMVLAQVFLWLAKKDRIQFAALLCLVVVGYTALTYGRNEVWQTPLSLWSDAVKKSPKKARPNLNVAAAYQQNGQYELAEKYYWKTLEIDPQKVKAWSNLGTVYVIRGDLVKAEEFFDKALEIEPEYVDALNGLGVIRMNQNRFGEAREYFEKIRQIAPEYLGLEKNLELLRKREKTIKN